MPDLPQLALNLLIQSTAVISLGLVAAWLLKRQGAALQSAIYRATLVVVCACPLVSFSLSQYEIEGWTFQLPVAVSDQANPSTHDHEPLQQVVQSKVSSTKTERLTKLDSLGEPLVDLSALAKPSQQAPSQSLIPAPPRDSKTASRSYFRLDYFFGMIAAGWILGSVILILRLAFAYAQVHHLRQKSISANDTDQSICRSLAASIQVNVPIVLRSPELSSPCLCGVLRPSILLPTDLQEPHSLKKAFAHELAHLRRADNLWNLTQRVGLALFCFQPLMWLLVYRLESSADNVCDDIVLEHCADRTGYAQQLVELAQSNLIFPNIAGVGMFTRRSELSRRVSRILDSSRNLTTQVGSRNVSMLTIASLACVLAGGAVGTKGVTTNGGENILAATSSEIEDQPQNFQGQVVDANGQPVVGAIVKFNTWNPYPEYNLKTAAETKTNQNGAFELTVPASVFSDKEFAAFSKHSAAIVIQASGFGGREFNWETSKSENAEKELKRIQLESENIVRGKIIDLEGKPIVGSSVEVTYADSLGNDLATKWISELNRVQNYGQTTKMIWHLGNPSLHSYSGSCKREHTTNEKGEFECRGLPLDSLVSFSIRHPSSTTQLFKVLNRPMKKVDADQGYVVHGDQPEIVVQPCRPICGTVVDSQTGLPVEGAKIYCKRMGTVPTVYGSSPAPRTHTDAEGKFELLGMPNSSGNRLMIYPPRDLPYLVQEINKIEATKELLPVVLTIKLDRGIWISGKVIDQQTGNGVKSTLRYFPLSNNPNMKNAKGFQSSHNLDHYTFFENYQTQDDGSFKIVGIPGRAILGASVDNQNYRSAVGYQEILDKWSQPYSADRIKAAAESGFDLSKDRFLPIKANYSFRNTHGSSFIAIQPTKDGLAIEQPIKLDPGQDLKIKVVAPNGKPIKRFQVSDFDGFWTSKEFTEGTAILKTMGVDEVRSIFIQEIDESKTVLLRVYANVSFKNNQVTLQAPAKISGTLKDKQGNPLKGYQVSGVATDQQGKFLLEDLYAGRSYDLQISRPKLNEGEKRPVEAGEFVEFPVEPKLEPGKTLDVGDIVVDPADYWLISGGISD